MAEERSQTAQKSVFVAPPAEDGLIQAWVCDQPPRGWPYRVLREEFIERSEDVVRLIYEIEMVQ